MQASSNKPVRRSDVDSGYAWVIVTVVTLNSCIQNQHYGVFGILYLDYVDAFGMSVGATGIALSVCSLTTYIAGMGNCFISCSIKQTSMYERIQVFCQLFNEKVRYSIHGHSEGRGACHPVAVVLFRNLKVRTHVCCLNTRSKIHRVVS